MRLLYRRVWEPLSGFPCSPPEALFNLLVLKLCLISQWESESRTPILSLCEPVNQTPRLISNWEVGTASELRATGGREVSLGFGEHRAALPKLGDQQGHRKRDLNIRYNWPVLGPLKISRFFSLQNLSDPFSWSVTMSLPKRTVSLSWKPSFSQSISRAAVSRKIL